MWGRETGSTPQPSLAIYDDSALATQVGSGPRAPGDSKLDVPVRSRPQSRRVIRVSARQLAPPSSLE